MYFSNQRQITINRENVISKTNTRIFLVAYIDNIQEAMKTLNKSTFQVYLYLLCNKDKHTTEYSPAHISQMTGICLDTAKKSFHELEEKGYIVCRDKAKKLYDFYEVRKHNIKNVAEKREFINEETGEIIKLTYVELQNEVGEIAAQNLWQEAKTL